MPEISYVNLACAKLTQETHESIDPDSLLKVRDTGESLVIITEEGKKHTFTFEELEDFYQYLEDNKPKPAEKPKSAQSSKSSKTSAAKKPAAKKKPSTGSNKSSAKS